MDLDSFEVTVRIRDVNPHIVCSLCAGYFVEATTITECLHTYCKSCIVKYLQTSKCCPTCNLLIHETQPLANLKLDRTMQDIVYKIVPGLEQAEEKRKQEFYDMRGLPVENPAMLHNVNDNEQEEKQTFVKRDFSDYKNSYRDDELVSLCLEPYGCPESGEDTLPNEDEESVLQESQDYFARALSKKYLRCSVRMRVFHLLKYLHSKLKVPESHQVEILCNEHVIQPCRTMKFIWITEWLEKDQPMILHYRTTES